MAIKDLQKIMAVAVVGMGVAAFSGIADVDAAVQDIYNRAEVARQNYQALHGDGEFPLSVSDPEYADIVKKYIYGDIHGQAKISAKERALVTMTVAVTDYNERALRNAIEEALAQQVTPLELRESIYHIAPYIGVNKTTEALTVLNDIFRDKGVGTPLPAQGRVTDDNRFDRGLALQVEMFGDRINQMRNATPDNQKHIQDNLSAFDFGDIFSRGTLDLKTREMLTLTAIGTLGIEAQFKGHVRGNLAMGSTEDEVVGVITTMSPYVGFPRTLWMLSHANEVFTERKTQ